MFGARACWATGRRWAKSIFFFTTFQYMYIVCTKQHNRWSTTVPSRNSKPCCHQLTQLMVLLLDCTASRLFWWNCGFALCGLAGSTVFICILNGIRPGGGEEAEWRAMGIAVGVLVVTRATSNSRTLVGVAPAMFRLTKWKCYVCDEICTFKLKIEWFIWQHYVAN